MQKAVNYGKNREVYLKRFLEDGYVPMHNSGSERCIIPLCIGRNNWKRSIASPVQMRQPMRIPLRKQQRRIMQTPSVTISSYLEELPPLLKEHGLDEGLSFLDSLMPWSESYRAYERYEREKYLQELSSVV